MRKREFTAEEIIDIIEMYKTNNLNPIINKYHVSGKTIINILINNNIPLHTREETKKIQRVKTEQTLFERYGDPHYNNKEQAWQTNIKKYGTKNNMQSELGMQEYRDAMQEKYGVDYTWELDSVKEKSKNTCFEHFGVYNTAQSDQAKTKQAETNIKKYGFKSALQNSEVQEKTKDTMIKEFGADHPSRSSEIISRMRQKYTYNNINFDSQPEIAFYIWLTDNNIKFIYQPNDKSIKYKDSLGKEHTYFPDFYLIDTNELIEIKGDNNFKDGKMINLSNRDLDYIANAKFECMVNNNVKIYTNKDYKIFVNYVNRVYGKNYLKQFKNKKDKGELND